MLIDRVLFRYGDGTEIITLESIEQHRDYILLKDHLYCITSNCRCKMIYIPKGKRIAHFKKWVGRKHKHSKECPYYKETEMDGRPKRIVGTKASLNDKHISGVLKNAFNKFLETEEERQLRLGRMRARPKKSYIIKEELFPKSIFVNKPNTSIMGQRLVEGEKVPYVRTRESIVHFIDGDIGETQATAGFFDSIVYEDETIIIIITDKQKIYPFQLYIEVVNSYKGVRKMLSELEKVLKTQDDVVVTCIGDIVKKNGRFGMRVKSASNLRINDYLIKEFIFKMDSLFNYVN